MLLHGSSSSTIDGPRRERAGKRDALLLAAGELVRIAPLAVRRGRRARAARRCGRRDRARGDAEADVLGHGQVREERVVLEHHADAAPLGRERSGRAPATTLPSRQTSPASGRSKPAIRRRSDVLPQPLGPSEGDELALLDAEVGAARPRAPRRSASRRRARIPSRKPC